MTPNSTILRIADRSTPKPSLNRTRQYVERSKMNKREEWFTIALIVAVLGLVAISQVLPR